MPFIGKQKAFYVRSWSLVNTALGSNCQSSYRADGPLQHWHARQTKERCWFPGKTTGQWTSFNWNNWRSSKFRSAKPPKVNQKILSTGWNFTKNHLARCKAVHAVYTITYKLLQTEAPAAAKPSELCGFFCKKWFNFKTMFWISVWKICLGIHKISVKAAGRHKLL